MGAVRLSIAQHNINDKNDEYYMGSVLKKNLVSAVTALGNTYWTFNDDDDDDDDDDDNNNNNNNN